jgi:hypothetical protein
VSAAATVTVFADNKGQRVHAVRPMSLIEVECLIRAVEPAAAKDKLPLLKLATFGNNKTDAGCLRFDANVTQVSGIEGDYDGEKMTMEEGAEKLRAAGIEALLYTSASHSPDRPRWRVLCRLATPLTGIETELRGQRKRLVGVLNAILGGVLKGESFALSQSFYFGHVKGRPNPVTRRTTGVCIDEMNNPPTPVYAISTATKATERDTSDSAKLLAKVAKLLHKGKDDEEIIIALVNDSHAKKQADPRRAIQRCIDKVRTDEKQQRVDAFEEINAVRCVIYWGGRVRILSQIRDPQTLRPVVTLASVPDMRVWYANRPYVNETPFFNIWLTHPDRRQYQGVVFEPNGNYEGYLNLWHGWGVTPVPGNCSLWLSMVRDVVCGGIVDRYLYVMEWIADAIQNPTVRPGVALVLRGAPGTGKGTFARAVGKLYGDHFLQINNARHLTGNFNAHLANTLLLFADEAYFPGDRTGEGALKALITEPTTPLELKGKDVISVSCHIRIIMASNSEWVVPAAGDDRRFAVFDVSRIHAQDTAYFGAIWAQLKTGGYEALLHHLQNYKLGGVDLRRIPDTEARREQQEQSFDSFFAFWRQRLQEPTGDMVLGACFLETNQLYKDYAAATRYHPLAPNIFAKRLKKLFPEARQTRRSTFIGESEIRKYGYELPPIETLRENFEVAVGRKLDWEDNDSVPGG